jgi:hypothetical protein
VTYLIVLVVLAVVVSAISAPLRSARAHIREPSNADRIAELEALRDAKYREIRDAELDVRTGKLSDADYEALDGSLRAEAVEILHELDRTREQLASAP